MTAHAYVDDTSGDGICADCGSGRDAPEHHADAYADPGRYDWDVLAGEVGDGRRARWEENVAFFAARMAAHGDVWDFYLGRTVILVAPDTVVCVEQPRHGGRPDVIAVASVDLSGDD